MVYSGGYRCGGGFFLQPQLNAPAPRRPGRRKAGGWVIGNSTFGRRESSVVFFIVDPTGYGVEAVGYEGAGHILILDYKMVFSRIVCISPKFIKLS